MVLKDLTASCDMGSIPVIDNFTYSIDLLSSITTERFYVIDVPASRICYVRPNEFFLCDHSVEDVLKLGYDFYKKIVYPDDLPLWEKMRKAVFLYLSDFKKQVDVDYFSCTFRLYNKYSFISRPLLQMIYQRMRPIWVDNKLCYMICSIKSSTTKKSGNLRMYDKYGLTFKEYNTTTQQWKCITIEQLSEREKAILMLAQQGKNSKEIANDLCKGFHTIRNQIKPIFSKLNVHSMQELIGLDSFHRMMSQKQEIHPAEIPHKRTRVLLADDIKQRIQDHLDNGKSIRQTAKLEGITESAIRYAIKQGKLRK